MQCTKPVRIRKNLSPSLYPDGLMVPCGKCLQCRVAKRKEWKLRMVHEMSQWDDSAFITLTYANEHLPVNGSLVKQDLQKYFKRLRKDIHPRKIKYFACGEYGDINQRPHYHAIIFGLAPKHSLTLKSNWHFGSTDVGTVTPESIQYVAQYIDKKFTGPLADEVYTQTGRKPVFKICSLGLGEKFAIKNKQQLVDNQRITLNGVEQSFPRYYIKKLGLEKSDFRKEKALLKDVELVKSITGEKNINFDLYYMTHKSEDVKKLVEAINKSRIQSEKNLEARIDLKKKKL